MEDFKNIRYLLDAVSVASKNIRLHPEFDISRNNYHLLTNIDKYVMDFYEYYEKTKSLTSDLNKIVIFIRRFPNKSYFENNGIDQLDYIRYHLEVFYHKIYTILEIKKRILMVIYEYKILKTESNWSELKKRSEIRGTEFEKLLNLFYDHFADIIENRHLNTHDAFFKDKEHTEIGSVILINKLEEIYKPNSSDRLRNTIPSYYIPYKLLMYRKDKIKYLKEHISAANVFVDLFLQLALNEFVIKHKGKVNLVK